MINPYLHDLSESIYCSWQNKWLDLVKLVIYQTCCQPFPRYDSTSSAVKDDYFEARKGKSRDEKMLEIELSF